MRIIQLFCFGVFVLSCGCVFGQDSSGVVVKEGITYKDVQSRARDHFMMQFGYMNWANVPDSVHIAGFNRQFKIYGMYDILIKGYPKMSVGVGAGLGWDNVYFGDSKIDVSKNSAGKIAIGKRAGLERYEKSKLTTLCLEIPGELRFVSNPRNYNRSWKFAVGLTYGILFQAYSKSENLLNESGGSIKNSTIVESDSRYFSGTRIGLHSRIGWGFFHVYGTYQLSDLFTAAGGPPVQTYSFGIGISGL